VRRVQFEMADDVLEVVGPSKTLIFIMAEEPQIDYTS
jgi:hypothetical protein